MNLQRADLALAFRSFVADGHGVLLGAPGAGKTHLLREFVTQLRSAQQDACLFLPVDRMPFESDADLRTELRAKGDILSFFARESQERHGYLIVDALDAVRGDRPRAFVLGLVRRVLAHLSDSWTVILSMRTYDALRSVELDEIFPPASTATPEAQYQLPGAVCRHFYVPALRDDEIAAAAADLPWLARLWREGHDDLRRLLRVPFNLWLLERLFERGTAVVELSPVHSEVQLLDLFWRQRVRSGPLAPDQRLLTSRAADAMVAQRTLWARTRDVYESGANEAWLALHSSEVLQEADGDGVRVSFGHNVLFDYAVSAELLQDKADAVSDFIREEPDRALFLRPTLNYFFARIWFTERELFWEILWTLLDADEPHVRLVAQVLPAGIIAREARTCEDVEPLLERLESNAEHSEEAVLRVLQALRTHGIADDLLWSQFAIRAAARGSHVYSWDLARFLSEILERHGESDAPDVDVRENVSSAARSLLRRALDSHDPAFEHLSAVWLIAVVALTYNVDPADARDLFATIILRIGDPDTSVDLVYRLADAVEHLWDNDPDLVESIYEAVFSHIELSDEPTHMGGIVVALQSNRRQDFEMAQYVLVEQAPRFLREQPQPALRALVKAATGAAVAHETLDATVESLRFEFRGRPVRYRQDSSHIWDAAGTIQDDAQKLLDAVLSYLAELPPDSAELGEAIDTVADSAELAFVWRGLLKAGSRDAARYTPFLHELLLAEPVLSNPETAPEAATFLAVAAPLINATDLRQVESVIVALAHQDDERTRQWAKRLIVQVPDDRVTTDGGRELKEEALSDPEARTNRPLISFSSFSERYDTEDWLRDEGVEPEDPANRRILTVSEPLEAFSSGFVNESAIPVEVIPPIIDAIEEVLSLVEENSLPAPLLDTAWARVGDAAAVAARAAPLNDREIAVLSNALLGCASGDAPRPVEDADTSFNFPAWSPAARNAAAQGIPRLLQHRADDELITALRTLAVDRAPSVRYLLALELPRLVPEHEPTFWHLAELYIARENNRVVLQAVGRALAAVASPDREQRVTDTLNELLERVALSEVSRTLPGEDQIGSLIVGLAVARQNEWAMTTLDQAVRTSPPSYLSTLVLHLLHYVDYRRVSDTGTRRMAEAALGWLPQILERVDGSLREEAEHGEVGSANRGDLIRDLFQVVDHIVSRFYFESGIYERQGRHKATKDEICLFFGVIQPFLRQIGEMAGGVGGLGLPARTAHHFIELLRGSLSCDPVEVLHLTRLAIDGARGAGYAFDPMAAREVTAIVETTLADHREVARAGEPLDDLTRVLDAFVAAGWPEAQRLVWRLEELFR